MNIYKKTLLLSFHVFLLSSRIIKTSIIDSVYFSCSPCTLLSLSNTSTHFFNTARRYNQDMNRFTQYGIPLRDRERGEHVRAYMCRAIRDATHTHNTHVPRVSSCRAVGTRRIYLRPTSSPYARYLPLSSSSLYNRRIQRALHIVKSINDQPQDTILASIINEIQRKIFPQRCYRYYRFYYSFWVLFTSFSFFLFFYFFTKSSLSFLRSLTSRI